MKKKEPLGDDDSLPSNIQDRLGELSKEELNDLSVTQIKKCRVLIDEAIQTNNRDVERF